MTKRILLFAVVFLLLLGLSVGALAHAVPDLTQRGSIHITMRHGGNPVPGGMLTLHQVGKAAEADGNYFFLPAGDFEGLEIDLSDIHAKGLADKLYRYTQSDLLIGTTVEIGMDAKVTFEDLEPGLYLLSQSTAAPGYSEIEPFLVSLPVLREGSYVYEVDASPKTELVPKPTEPGEPDIPQTGQLNWPVPVLTVAGLLLMTLGTILVRKKDGYGT